MSSHDLASDVKSYRDKHMDELRAIQRTSILRTGDQKEDLKLNKTN